MAVASQGNMATLSNPVYNNAGVGHADTATQNFDAATQNYDNVARQTSTTPGAVGGVPSKATTSKDVAPGPSKDTSNVYSPMPRHAPAPTMPISYLHHHHSAQPSSGGKVNAGFDHDPDVYEDVAVRKGHGESFT